MQTGNIVKSLKGHDTDRVYLVVAVVNADFVLLSDGEYRKLDNPKQKRIKHVRLLAENIALPADLKDSDIRNFCKIYMEG